MTTLDLHLLPGRCPDGFDVATQHPQLCACPAGTQPEWSRFKAALREAVGADGLIHQTDVRPRIQSIFHKRRGRFYSKAQTEGLIVLVGREPSTDVAGKNTDKDQKVYRWTGRAA